MAFLHSVSLRTTALRRRRAIVPGLVLLTMLISAALVLADVASRTADARDEMFAARAELLAARTVLDPLIHFDGERWPDTEDYRAARASVGEARARVTHARERLGYVERLAPVAARLPGIPAETVHAPLLLDVSERLVTSLDRLLAIVDPLFLGDDRIALAAREVFVVHGDELLAELGALETVRADAEELRAVEWSGRLAPVAGLLEDLSDGTERVPDGIELVLLLQAAIDPLLGFGSPVRYVVLGQNDHEIRATGGYIGTMGTIELVDGELVASDYRSSREFTPDPIPERYPPEPMIRFAGSGYWLLREANWWPHFPDSAEVVLEFMVDDHGIEADGVIAVDSEMTRLLLEVFGPIEVAEFDGPLSAENWFVHVEDSLAEAASELGQERAREAYLGAVLEELVGRVQDAGSAEIPGMMRAFRRGAEGRHFQMHSRAAPLQALIARFEADGSMQRQEGADFVAVIDSNHSFNKLHPAIEREVTYAPRRDGAIDLTIRWSNQVSTYEGARYERLGRGGGIWHYETMSVEHIDGVFGNFARIYLLPDIELISARGFTSAPRYERENGFTVISGWVQVEDGEEQTVELRYRLPPVDYPTPPPAVFFWKQGGGAGQSWVSLVGANPGEIADAERLRFDRDLLVPLR